MPPKLDDFPDTAFGGLSRSFNKPGGLQRGFLKQDYVDAGLILACDRTYDLFGITVVSRFDMKTQ